MEADTVGVNGVLVDDHKTDMRRWFAEVAIAVGLDPDPTPSEREGDQAGLRILSRFAAEGFPLDGEYKHSMRPRRRAEL